MKKMEKIPRGIYVYLLFAITKLKIEPIGKMRKIDMKIVQNGLLSPIGNSSGACLMLPSEPIKHCSHNKNWSCIKR